MGSDFFRENVVALTGASSGIGWALAVQLAEQGALVSLTARNSEKLAELERLCRSRGGRALAVPGDIAQPEQCERFIHSTAAEYGQIDTLINNAGIGMLARFDELQDLSLVERVMRVKFMGSPVLHALRATVSRAQRGPAGCVSSLGGKFPAPLSSVYAASKHAPAGFFDSIRVELAESGVSVTMIYPGWVATGISARPSDPTGSQSAVRRRTKRVR